MKNKQTIIIPTSGAVNPGVPRGRSPLSVNLFGRLLGESKSANFAYLDSPHSMEKLKNDLLLELKVVKCMKI